MGLYDDVLGGAPAATTAAKPAPTTKRKGLYDDVLSGTQKPPPSSTSAPSPLAGIGGALRFGLEHAAEPFQHAGSAALDLLGRPGQAAVAGIARGPAAAGQAFVHGGAPTQDADLDTLRHKAGLAAVYDTKAGAGPVRQWLHQAGRGMIDAGLQMAVDPTTYLGGSGALEHGVNAAGRQAYVGLARGLQRAPEALQQAHDFVTPGGSAMGAAKRTLTAKEGAAGLDKYLARKAQIARGEPFAAAPQPKPGARSPRRLTPDVPLEADRSNAPFTRPGSSRLPNLTGVAPKPKLTLAQAQEFFKKQAAKSAAKPVEPTLSETDQILANMGKKGRPDIISQLGQTSAGKLAKRATKGTTGLMFTVPQLPGMQGHGSNILQTALLSDPASAIGGTARFLASGEALPGPLRTAAQKIPGVKQLAQGQRDAVARAVASGAATETPERDIPNLIAKIPGLGQLAKYSGRTLWDYDQAMKGSLNDSFLKQYGGDAARAADRVGQDIVNYGDRSDLTRALGFGLPFATYATKKPGIIARAVARHPERVLALTRNNPNFQPDRSEPMADPDAGRPLASIYNALNNKSPSAKGGAPFPGAQYLRASAGAPLQDLLGAIGNPYFTYGPPAKHADGNALAGWLKLLLTQAVGNAPGGEAALDKTGLNYFGGR